MAYEAAIVREAQIRGRVNLLVGLNGDCRMVALAAIVGLSILAMLAQPSEAGAISRAKAEAAALAALGVKKSEHNVIVFGLGKTLRASQSVTFANAGRLGIAKPSRTVKRRLPDLGRKAWLFWADHVPYAHFAHPSQLVLIDDRTGRVLRNEMTGWYPLVDGRRPAFLRSPAAYSDRRWQVFRRMELPAAESAAPARTLARDLGGGTGQQLPADLFKEDCILLVGSHRDPHFAKDFTTMRELGRLVGKVPGQTRIRSWYATVSGMKPAIFPPDRHGDDPQRVAGKKGAKDKKKRKGKSVGDVLAEDVAHLANKQGCKDVLIFIAGHGFRTPSGNAMRQWLKKLNFNPRSGAAKKLTKILNDPKWSTNKPTVQIGEGNPNVVGDEVFLNTDDLADLVRQLEGKVTFKFKIQSCFSGRFSGPLSAHKNVLAVETSSGAAETSFRDIKLDNPPADAPQTPKGVGEFVNSNLRSMISYLGSSQAVTDFNTNDDLHPLVKLMIGGWGLGGKYDISERLGYTTPTLRYRMGGTVMKKVSRNAPPLSGGSSSGGSVDTGGDPDPKPGGDPPPPPDYCTTSVSWYMGNPSLNEPIITSVCSRNLIQLDLADSAAPEAFLPPSGMTCSPVGTILRCTGNVPANTAAVTNMRGPTLAPGASLTATYSFDGGGTETDTVTLPPS